MDKALKIIDRRMRECNDKAQEFKRTGNDVEMYKLNTAWHWLDSVRRELAAN